MFKHIQVIIFFLNFILISDALSWGGTDQGSGNTIEIEHGNLVREGEEIEIYDYSDGAYKSLEISDINRFGTTVEIEGTNIDTGESHILEMDD
jgi:hypothetical protein